MELAKGNYLILRPLSASNNHVYLYSIFQLPPIFLEAVYTTLKADKDNYQLAEYLKEKEIFF